MTCACSRPPMLGVKGKPQCLWHYWLDKKNKPKKQFRGRRKR